MFPILFLIIWLLLSFSHSYTARVVGNGLHAQRQNPEVKVRSPNPTLAEVKERLERFNQVGWPLLSMRTSLNLKLLSYMHACTLAHTNTFIHTCLFWPNGASESFVCSSICHKYLRHHWMPMGSLQLLYMSKQWGIMLWLFGLTVYLTVNSEGLLFIVALFKMDNST